MNNSYSSLPFLSFSAYIIFRSSSAAGTDACNTYHVPDLEHDHLGGPRSLSQTTARIIIQCPCYHLNATFARLFGHFLALIFLYGSMG